MCADPCALYWEPPDEDARRPVSWHEVRQLRPQRSISPPVPYPDV